MCWVKNKTIILIIISEDENKILWIGCGLVISRSDYYSVKFCGKLFYWMVWSLSHGSV